MKAALLKEWSPQQHKIVQKAVKKYLNSRFFENSHGYTANLYNSLGLAYTSSSSCAGLWVCNIEAYLDARHLYTIEGFVMCESSFVYALCMDKDENELLIPIN